MLPWMRMVVTNFCINIFINKLIFSNKYGSVLSSTTGEPELDHLLNQTSGPVQGSLRQPELNCQSGSRFCQSGRKTGPNRTLAALNNTSGNPGFGNYRQWRT